MNASLALQSGTLLHDIGDDKNLNNQRLQHHSLLKKVCSKLYDSSLQLESYQLSDSIRSSTECYENINSSRGLGNSAKEIISLQKNLWTIDSEIKKVRSSIIYDGTLIIFILYLIRYFTLLELRYYLSE